MLINIKYSLEDVLKAWRREAILLLFAVAFLSIEPVRAAQSSKAITVMIYMCGSNLESDGRAATADITEMLRSGFNQDEVNVIVMAGGSVKWWSGFSAEETAIYELSGPRPKKAWAEGLLNMGEADTLEKLLTFGYEEYPADRYALIMWNHGGGPMSGVCWDSLAGSDNLSMIEMQDALNESPFTQTPLEWIGFDACLMSSVETAYLVSPYADYMIASQETEPGQGWSYAFLNGLEKDVSGADSGKRIIEEYINGAKDISDTLTLSCIDLNQIGEVETAMDELFSRLSGSLSEETFSEIAKGRQESRTFGRASDNGSDCDLVDLTDLAEHYAQQAPEQAEALMKAIDNAVVSEESTDEHSHGLSVYHPFYNKELFSQIWEEEYSTFFFAPEYTQYLQRFTAIWLGNTLADWSKLLPARQMLGAAEDGMFSFQLSEEQRKTFASAKLVVLEKTEFGGDDVGYMQVYMDDDVTVGEDGLLSAKYTGKALYVVDEKGRPISEAIPYDIVDGEIVVRINYINDKTEKRAFTLTHYIVAEDGASLIQKEQYVHDTDSDQYTNRLQIDYSEYEKVHFSKWQYHMPVNVDIIPSFDQWERNLNIAYGEELSADREWHLKFFDYQLSDEKLYAAFQISDTQNNRFSTELVQVKNKDIREIETKMVSADFGPFTIKPSAYILGTELSKGAEIVLDITSESRRTWTFEVLGNRLTVNGTKVVTDDYPGINRITVHPQETASLHIELGYEELTGIAALDDMSFVLRYSLTTSEDPYAGLSVADPEEALRNVTLHFNHDMLKNSAKQADVDVYLGETEQDGVLFRILSLEETASGSLTFFVFVENRTEKSIHRAFEKVMINRHLFDLEHRPEWMLMPGENSVLPLTVRNESYQYGVLQNEGDVYHFTREGLLEDAGITDIKHITLIDEGSWVWMKTAQMGMYYEGFSAEVTLDRPYMYQSPEDATDVPDVLTLLDDSVLRVSLLREKLMDGIILQDVEIENKSNKDIILYMDDAKINGLSAKSVQSLLITSEPEWLLHADSVTRLCLITKIETAEEMLLNKSSFCLYYETGEEGHLSEVCIEYSGSNRFNVPLGDDVPLEDVALVSLKDHGTDPLFNEDIKVPDNMEQYRKMISADIPENDKDVDFAYALVLYPVENRDDMPGKGFVEISPPAMLPVSCVFLEKDVDCYSGITAGLRMTFEGYEDHTVCIMEEGKPGFIGRLRNENEWSNWVIASRKKAVSSRHMEWNFIMEADFRNSKVTYLNNQLRNTLGYNEDENSPRIDYSRWPAGLFSEVSWDVRLLDYEINEDGSFDRGKYHGLTAFNVIKPKGVSLKAEFEPVEMMNHDLYVGIFYVMKDGTTKCGRMLRYSNLPSYTGN